MAETGGGQAGGFSGDGDGRGAENTLTFRPFYKLSDRRYGIYWDVYTPEEWKQRGEAADTEAEQRRKLEAATVGFAQPGQMQAERDYNFQGDGRLTVIAGDNAGRRSSKWFSFDLPVDDKHPMTLVVTYSSGERAARSFDVLIDGKRLKSESVIPAVLRRTFMMSTIRFPRTRHGETEGDGSV